MSFTSSNLNTNNFKTVYISGANAVACSSSNLGIYYSTNYGQTWTQSTHYNGAEPSTLNTGSFNSIFLEGNIGVVGCAGGNTVFYGILYTSDAGQTWRSSPRINGNFKSTDIFNSIHMYGQYSVACGGGTSSGILFSSDYGYTWTSTNITTGLFNSIKISGANGVAAASTIGLYYTSNYGQSWAQAKTTSDVAITGTFNSVVMNGQYCIAGGAAGKGIYYSTNYGVNWTQITSPSARLIPEVSLSGTRAIAASGTNNTSAGTGLYYSSDSGQTWTQSNISTGNFLRVMLDGANGIASATTSTTTNMFGLFVTNDYGQTWTQTNITTGSFNDVFISNIKGIIASVGAGIYYNSSALCYNKSTTVLCIIDDGTEQYVPISDLNIGDNVKIYNQESQSESQTKKIKYINYYNHLCMDSTNDLDCIYKSNDDHNLIVSGGHSLLVDNLTDQQQELNMRFNFNEKINDKHLLLASSNENFTNITRQYPETMQNPTKLYHLVLENDDDIDLKYGIYVNDGVLSETCSQREYMKIHIA